MFFRECDLTEEQIKNEVDELIEKMSIKEKIWLLNGNWDFVYNKFRYKKTYKPKPIMTNGNKRLKIKPIAFTDGSRGVVMGQSTCFPVPMARGASFDVELEKRIGEVMGIEARAGGANVFGGICLNILMNPSWGRAQETYGEDPFLTGELGKALTLGVQEHNVMACLKHFALNNIENTRFHVDVRLEEKTLQEIYLPQFKKCIDAGAAAVMGSYNKVRGEQACENKQLLTDILRDDWGFNGFVISDFVFGIKDGRKAIEAGLDVEMPMPIKFQKQLLHLVQNGEVSEESIDKSVRRLLNTQLTFEQAKDKRIYPKNLIARESHTELAEEAALKSMVMLKNEKHVLPFSKNIDKVLVIGGLGFEENIGDHGKGRMYPPYVVSPIQGLQKYFDEQVEIICCHEDNIVEAKVLSEEVDCVIIIAGNNFEDEGELVLPDSSLNPEEIIRQGFRNQKSPVKAKLVKSYIQRQLNKNHKIDLSDDEIGMKMTSSGDRKSLSLKDNEIRLIKEVGRINENTAVVLVGGSMIMMNEWEDEVNAILHSWYSGMEGGNALAKILFGEVCPSGKLPFAIPYDAQDLHPFDNTSNQVVYEYYHGYRRLDYKGIKPKYPFGFGLSYTEFKLSDVSVFNAKEEVVASTVIKNIGEQTGEEVVQVYVSVPDSPIERHVKVLKGFIKVELKPGEHKRVKIVIPHSELTYFNSLSNEFILEKGVYEIKIGTSSKEENLLVEAITLN